MERRLVAKLQSAGQLRAGFLIRAIREKRLSLFEHSLAALGGFSVAQVRQRPAAPSPRPCYACAAVGIDRAVFPAVLDEIRKLNQRPARRSGAEVGHARRLADRRRPAPSAP
jgi:hypothetical protein